MDFDDEKSSYDVIDNVTMSDDEVVASYGPPRSLLLNQVTFLMRLCISIRGRVRPSVRRSVRPSIPRYFQTPKIEVFECGKSSNIKKHHNIVNYII